MAGDARRSHPTRTLITMVMLGAGALGTSAVQAGADPPSPRPGPPSQPPVERFLDPGFGTAGRVDTEGFGGDRSAMALQPDGRIVMVGGTFVDFVLARFGTDGQLDPTFGVGGQVTTDIVPDQQEEALAVAIGPDGRIVVAGYVGFDATVALARYEADGSLDPTFGEGGRVSGTVPGRAYAVALQPDGAIVVAGEAEVEGSATDDADLLVARFLPDGSLDASFGDGGRIATDVAGGTNTACDVVVLPDGRIQVSGEPYGSFEGKSTDLARYGPDGALDPSFGDGGVLTLPGAFLGEGLAIQADGRLVLAGTAGEFGATTFALLRLDADGQPDATFGDGGMVTTDVGDQGDAAMSVAIGGDGRIVAAGWSGDINHDFAAVRYLPDGAIDPSFANAGTLTIDFWYLTDIAESVAIAPDGMTVLGGSVQHGVKGYGVARVLR